MSTEKVKKVTLQSNENLNSAVRVTKEVGKLLKDEIDKLNKQKRGTKKVNVSDVIKVSLSLLKESHRTQIMSETVTSEDRQKVAYENFHKKHKTVSKGDFLDLIQYGEIQINDYLPDDMKRQKKMRNVKGLDAA